MRCGARRAVRRQARAVGVLRRRGCAVPGRNGARASDVAAGDLPTVGMLVPDLDHDAHDGTLATADEWLHAWLPGIMAGPDFLAGRLAIVVTADEDDGSAGNQVLTVVIAPGVTHEVVTSPLSHYSLTGLLCEVAGVPPLREAAGAPRPPRRAARSASSAR